MKKIVVGAIAGGVVLFLWGWVSHMLLPLGEMGLRRLPNEEAVIGVMRGSISRGGLYFFPYMDHSGKGSAAEQNAWEEKYIAGPTGLIVYSPGGERPMSPAQLLREFGTGVLAALIAAILLSQTGGGFLARVVFVTLLGLFSWVTISLPYWNWYRFPQDFTLAEGIDQVAGWFLAGLVLAIVVRPGRR